MREWVILLVAIGIGVLFTPIVDAGGPTSEQGGCTTACASFGVQKLLEKKKAPAFSLKTVDGNEISLSDLQGRPALLIFWASWCGSL